MQKPLTPKTAFALASVSVLASATPASAALVWTRANTPDADTLAHYQFEGTGTAVTDNSAAGNNTMLSSDVRANEATGHWLGGGPGNYLQNTGGNYLTQTPGSGVTEITGVDWNKGLTASFWYRVRDGSLLTGNEIFEIENNSQGGIQRPHVRIDTDTSGNGRLRLRADQGGNGGLNNFGNDLVWRHLALVYNPAALGNPDASDGGNWSFYIDNVVVTSFDVPVDLTVADGNPLRFSFMSGVGEVGSGVAADFDELFIHNGVITDFSDGFVIPEPASLALLGLGGLLLAGRRRR